MCRSTGFGGFNVKPRRFEQHRSKSSMMCNRFSDFNVKSDKGKTPLIVLRCADNRQLLEGTGERIKAMIKYLSLFRGIGAFEKALQRLEIPYELVGYCEIDKYASKAYSLLHSVPESMNFGDITQLDETQLPDDIDLITYGFPCQDISLAGQQKGLLNDDGTKTRSGLFFDALRIIEHTQPQIAIAENVKNLTSQKFSEQFDTVLSSLENVGYNNYWKVLNAKDYEVPQNRERVFIISIRKDIDTGVFEFPDPVPLKKCLKDLLEDSVEEKYYVDPERVKNLIPQLTEKQISNTVRGGRGSVDRHTWDMIAVQK